jgi:hypothetical protein
MCYLVAVQARQRPARSLASRLVGSLYPLNRSDNVIGQEFRKIVGGAEGAYQWVILWNGVCNVARITDGCEKMFANVEATVNRVGTRTALTLATLEARWRE